MAESSADFESHGSWELLTQIRADYMVFTRSSGKERLTGQAKVVDVPTRSQLEPPARVVAADGSAQKGRISGRLEPCVT